jgi:hypothetical protein
MDFTFGLSFWGKNIRHTPPKIKELAGKDFSAVRGNTFLKSS